MIWKKEIQILNLIIVRLKAIQCRFLKNRYLIFFQKRSSPAWVQRPETHQNVKHLVCVWLIDLLHVMPVVLLSTDGYHPYQPRTGTDRSTWCSSSCRCSRTEGEREVRETLQCFIKWNIYHLSLSCLSAWAPRAEYEQVEVLVRFWQRPSLQRYWDHRATHSPSTLQLTVSRLQGTCPGFTFSPILSVSNIPGDTLFLLADEDWILVIPGTVAILEAPLHEPVVDLPAVLLPCLLPTLSLLHQLLVSHRADRVRHKPQQNTVLHTWSHSRQQVIWVFVVCRHTGSHSR